MSLSKRPPENMLKLQSRARKYIQVEKNIKKTVVNNEPVGGKKRKTDQEYDVKDKYPRVSKETDLTPKKGGPGKKFTEYARLNAPKIQIFMKIEKDRDVHWPKPLKTDPAKLDKRKYYRFHKVVGHDTDECRQLKDEIKFLIRKRRLIGSSKNSIKAYAREVMHIIGEAPKRAKTGVEMTFDDFDLEGVKFSHDDPLVITHIIGNNPVMRVIVDNEASVDILLYDTFIRMGYNDSQLTPVDMPIYGFAGVECLVEGIIKLPLTMGQEPRQSHIDVKFYGG
ncbi:uncharacterized protein LOC141715111 [Apium graveolens]|uniref:uncharacterized protein LOC141715111 n=1 Tax=Apium graveolens TaxID=4045 RepID=UPI003D7962A9